LVTLCIPHGEDKEKKQTTFQHYHNEPEINKQKKCTHMLNTAILNAFKDKNTSGRTFIQKVSVPKSHLGIQTVTFSRFCKSQSLCNTVIFSYLLSAEGQYLYTSYQEVTTGVLCKKQTLPFMVY